MRGWGGVGWGVGWGGVGGGVGGEGGGVGGVGGGGGGVGWGGGGVGWGGGGWGGGGWGGGGGGGGEIVGWYTWTPKNWSVENHQLTSCDIDVALYILQCSRNKKHLHWKSAKYRTGSGIERLPEFYELLEAFLEDRFDIGFPQVRW